MVRTSGVETSRIGSLAGPRAGGGGAGVSSRFAAYVPASLNAMSSSPDSASTWNSSERLPPIAPESASTTRKSRPVREKMRRYASRIAS